MGASAGTATAATASGGEAPRLVSDGPFDDVGIWYPSVGASYFVEDVLETQGLAILRTPGSRTRVVCTYDGDPPARGSLATAAAPKIAKTLSIPTVRLSAASADVVLASRRREGR